MGCRKRWMQWAWGCLPCLSSIVMFLGVAGLSSVAQAEVWPMTDKDLSDVTAQTSPISISMECDTVRIFLDAYLEVYQETDKVRLGYYYKSPAELTTRKGLNPGDYPSLVLLGPVKKWDFKGGDLRVDWQDIDIPGGTFTGDIPSVDEQPDKWGSKRFRVDMDPDTDKELFSPWQLAVEYTLYRGDDKDSLIKQKVYVPWVDDDNYMYKYKEKLGDKWVDGAQGDNDQLVLFSSQTYRNRNYLDWDFAVDNLRMGLNPDEPVRINGLVIRLKYDDINSPNRKLTDIIVGTNDLQGDLSFDYKRATGIYSPKLPHQASQVALQAGGDGNGVAGTDLAEEFNSTPIPVFYQRDTMMSLVDQFNLSRNYKQPKGEAWIDAVPDNPLSNNQHSGFFIRIGLDRNSPHFGYQLVGGYNERIASSFQYKGENLNESLYNWWNGIEPSVATTQYPASLQKVYSNDPNVTGYSYYGTDTNYFP
ncbi:hypothetical protein DSLASN_29420 [Desulfoluna limicola]|uniref:Uncharacterized protein n=1 Tax=Desulfoluna limicola TaxID=2810562 RepID=A0ABM7PIA9_9BACT|nr:hypothetical protein [Desulfoluna limicola]BCS97310.1 hypothetical protein DSLASN_29420 [Desulfoluna limicola]